MNRDKILKKSIANAKKWIILSTDPAHDIQHILSVKNTALKISKEIKYNDTLLIETICWWHDVGRLFSPIHEELSAQIAKYNLLGYGCDKKTINTVYEGIRFHKWKMKPKTLEGNILRDADKLDFISIKRWRGCIKLNELEHITPIVELLPRLRDILKLEGSKKLYDIRIKKFLKYAKSERSTITDSLIDKL
jgi:hypothetical protein